MSDKDLGLGENLWAKIEAPQGYSFVADDVIGWPDAQVLEFVQNALPEARKVVRILESFNKKYYFGDHA